MRLLTPISEAEMVAVFLKGESSSQRFQKELEQAAEKLGSEWGLIENPNVKDEKENSLRHEIFAEYRGWSKGEQLFENFPTDVSWHRAELTKDEVLKIKYINYSYWNELSNNSRLPTEAAETIRAGKTVFDVSNQNFLTMADALRNGAKFPELILVASSETSELVVLEGHARLTAYALAPDFIPDPFTVIVGISPEMVHWIN